MFFRVPYYHSRVEQDALSWGRADWRDGGLGMIGRTLITCSGVLFDYERFEPDDFLLEDITVALQNLTLFSGQVPDYTIAQHSALTAMLIKDEPSLQRYALLEHASAAYFMSCTRERFTAKFHHWEARAQEMIFEKFCIRAPNKEELFTLGEWSRVANRIALGLLCPMGAMKHSLTFIQRGTYESGVHRFRTLPSNQDFIRLIARHWYIDQGDTEDGSDTLVFHRRAAE